MGALAEGSGDAGAVADPTVFWGMHPILHEISDAHHTSAGTTLAHKVWRYVRQSLQSSFDAFGLSEDHFPASAQSIKAQSAIAQEVAPEARHRFDQRSGTTIGVLVCLAHWSCFLRKRSKQFEATSILEHFTESALGGATDQFQVPEHLFDEVSSMGECPLMHEGGRRCSHVQGLPGVGAQTKLHGKIAADLVDNFALAFACPRLLAWCRHLLETLADIIDEQVIKGHVGSRALEAYVIGRGMKRARRVCAPVSSLLQEGVESKRFRSTAGAVRNLALPIGETTARYEEHKAMLPYFWSVAAIVRDSSQLNISMDSSRLGGEDTSVFAVYVPEKQKGGWLVPQVPWGGGGGGEWRCMLRLSGKASRQASSLG